MIASYLAPVLSILPNICLFWKIIYRSSIHNLFNITLSVQLLINAFLNPIYFYHLINLISTAASCSYSNPFNNSISIGTLGYNPVQSFEDRSYSCGVFHLLQSILTFSHLVFLSCNLLYRCQYIINADYGFLRNGLVDTKFTDNDLKDLRNNTSMAFLFIG